MALFLFVDQLVGGWGLVMLSADGEQDLYIFQKKIIIVNRSLYECLNYHNKTIKKQTCHSKAPHPIPAFFYAAPRLWTRQWQVKR